MAESMRLRLNGDRQLLLERLREQLGIDKDRWKADVVDAALIHTFQSIEAMESLRGEVDPNILKEFNTDVVQAKYRTSLEAGPADPGDLRL